MLSKEDKHCLCMLQMVVEVREMLMVFMMLMFMITSPPPLAWSERGGKWKLLPPPEPRNPPPSNPPKIVLGQKGADYRGLTVLGFLIKQP